jgi:adenosine deaminase
MLECRAGEDGVIGREAPKVELHCHLDCCVRVGTVAAIGRETGLALPASLEQALVAPEVCHDLADYIRRIDLALEVMQRPEDLRRIARELVEDFAADGVIYAEVRFAPQLHTRRGLTLQQVVDAVHAGLAEGTARHAVRTGLILCCLRHQAPEDSLAIAELAIANRDRVCALDLAGDEARFPGAPHAPAFERVRAAGLHRTIHAGEAAGSESVREALDVLAAERIGHGVRIEEDPALVDEVRRRAIALEMCPTSNVQTRAVGSLEAHPIDRLRQRGLRVTVSTDGRTVSATSVTEEFRRLAAHKAWTAAEFWLCQRNAAEAAFVSPPLREDLLRRLSAAEKPPAR